METGRTPAHADFVARLIADYKLACFARALLETRSVAAAVGREE
jgi:hypothetical protein